jgi:hypothetical protein
MSGGTEVIIRSQTVEAQIVANGLAVSLVNESLPETIMGVPGPAGPKGADGQNGVDGAPGAPGPAGADGQNGAGLPVGGQTGQVPVKQSAADYDLGWFSGLTLDPVTGRAGLGTNAPQGPAHIAGDDQALVLENTRAPGAFFSICPGRFNLYENNAIFTRGTDIQDPANYLMRFNAIGVAVFEKGLGVADGQSVNSSTSGFLAFYKPYDGVRGELSFRGADNSGKAEFVIGSYFHDGAWHQQNIGVGSLKLQARRWESTRKRPLQPCMLMARCVLAPTPLPPCQAQQVSARVA